MPALAEQLGHWPAHHHARRPREQRGVVNLLSRERTITRLASPPSATEYLGQQNSPELSVMRVDIAAGSNNASSNRRWAGERSSSFGAELSGAVIRLCTSVARRAALLG